MVSTGFSQKKEDLNLDVAQNLINFMTEATSKIKHILNECPHYTNGKQPNGSLSCKFNTTNLDDPSIIENKCLSSKNRKRNISCFTSLDSVKKTRYIVPLKRANLFKNEIKMKKLKVEYCATSCNSSQLHAVHSKNVFSQYFKKLKKDFSNSSLYEQPKSVKAADSSSNTKLQNYEHSTKLQNYEILNENTFFASKSKTLPYFPQELKSNEINFDEITDSILLTDIIPQNELQKYLF
ncbi:uncharacterized protein LOC105846858 [Hydra vulgaris]|uniref:uncharacterized protein LOC105846858 n=1 Tax=Hydra vulgaris TaxID=6087 RepID=UPI000640BE64|nr:uncharacterized protein LOC105846858 [Hydra vulgaris]